MSLKRCSAMSFWESPAMGNGDVASKGLMFSKEP